MVVFVLIEWSNLTNNYLKIQVKTIKKLRRFNIFVLNALFIS
jgi:hypothetical protein